MAGASRGPELLAVHIPRTAGSAFNVVLDSVYGRENVERDSNDQVRDGRPPRVDFDAWNRETRAAVERRTAWPKVVTGHSPLWKYESLRRSAFTVVWLREPAARLISMYFYLRSRSSTPGPEAGAFARGDIPPERMMDVEWPSNPVTQRFLRGYDVDDLDFVGIQEHFAEDVAELGRTLGWPAVDVPVHNRMTTREYLDFRPSTALLRKIRSANDADLELYERALELRRNRIAGREQAGQKLIRT